MKKLLLSVAGVLSVVACGVATTTDSQVKLRDMTTEEALADFDTLVATFRDQYGPLEFKERRFGFNFNELTQSLRAEIEASSSDKEVFNIYSRFVSSFRDGHVSIRFNGKNTRGENSARIPLFAEPIEGQPVITGVLEESVGARGIEVGDIVLSIDGTPAADLLEGFKKTDAFGNPVSDEHLYYLLFNRFFEQGELYPEGKTARVQVQKADGSVLEADLTWRRTNDIRLKLPDAGVSAPGRHLMIAPRAADLNKAAGIDKWGGPEPFFKTAQVAEQFGFVEVKPNETFLQKYGLDAETAPEIYAALYEHNGQNVLLIRQRTYSTETYERHFDYLAAYRAILDQYDSLADVLVVDQTNNPGGFLSYCVGFSQLFMSQPGANFMQAMNADRKWIDDFRQYAYETDPDFQSEDALKYLAVANAVERSYDAGESITEPVPFFGDNTLLPDSEYTWNKPMLVLINELAGSCGDIFPMMVKKNQTGVLFGKRTMGLGGNVEGFDLSASRASVRLTRGLFTSYKVDGAYEDADFAENNGVLPDIPYEPTLADFHQGYTDYVRAFSDEATALVGSTPSP